MLELSVSDFANRVGSALDDDGTLAVFKAVRADKTALRGGFRYSVGLNVDENNSSGLHFVWHPEDILNFTYFGMLDSSHVIAVCRVPHDARVGCDNTVGSLREAKTNRLIVDNFMSQNDFFQHMRYFALPSVRLKAVKTNGAVIERFSQEQRTPEVCLAAVQHCGHAIVFLTDEQRTPEVCLAAVTKDASAIRHLSDAQKTLPVCIAAVNSCGYLIGDISREKRNSEMCLSAVRHTGMAIRHLNAEEMTSAVCLAAVKSAGSAIQFLTDAQRTYDVRVAAVRQNGIAIQYLEDHHRTPEICRFAFQQNPDVKHVLSYQQMRSIRVWRDR